jgi:altronate dehydratase large subunit
LAKEFLGYERIDGAIGVRNKILVIAPTNCSYQEATRIAKHVSEAVVITQYYGCRRDLMLENQFIGLASNPNIAAVLLVGLGCESLTVEILESGIEKLGKPMATVVSQEDGGTLKTIEKGTQLLQNMVNEVRKIKQKSFDVSNLTLALECGGSDATSGLAANPAVGEAVDILIDSGGTAILSEPLEMVGAEDILAKRAMNNDVADKIHELVRNAEKRALAQGIQSRSMSKGNIDGGLTTIEEKSLGAILKGGTSEIVGVLENSRKKLERPNEPGLYLQDGINFDIPSITHMAAAGAQLAIFTTGRGTTTGHAIVPVIKITGNTATYDKMEDDMDINAGVIIDGLASIKQIGKDIFDSIIQVASGKKTKSELLGYNDFVLWRTDPAAENLIFHSDR